MRLKSGAWQSQRHGPRREGVHLLIAARRREVLKGAADEIASATGNCPKTVVADVTTKDGRDAILAACPAPDILVNNAGWPPLGDFRKFERDDWIKALDGNMLAPIALIKVTLDGMISRRFGRIVNITSHAVPVPMLALSNGARTGLTGFVAGLARTTAEHNVTINNLLPGTFDTDRLKPNLADCDLHCGQACRPLLNTLNVAQFFNSLLRRPY